MKKQMLLALLLIFGLTVAMPAIAGHHAGDHKCKGASCPLKSQKQCALKSGGHDCAKSKCSEKGKEYQCPISSKIMKKSCFLLSNAETIGLSDEQVASIKDIKISTKKDIIQQGAGMKVFELDLKQMLSKKPIDQEAINGMIDGAAAGWGVSGKQSVQRYIDLKAVLTDAQMEKAKAIWKKK